VDGAHFAPTPGRLGEPELVGLDLGLAEVAVGTAQGLEVQEVEPEEVVEPGAAVRPHVGPRGERPVAADQTAQIAAAVLGRLLGWPGEPARAEEGVRRGEERPLPFPSPRPGDVPPSALGEEAVVAARDELRPALEHDAVRGPDRRPVGQDLRLRVAAVAAPPLGSQDAVADAQIAQGPRPPVGQQDRRVAVGAVDAGMAAASVRVDRPAERHA
jgi:hypothetical protein